MAEILDKTLQENEAVKTSFEIKYHLPSFVHRVLANLIDILLVAFCFICCFLLCRSIVLNSDSYKRDSEIVKSEQINSGLYKEKDGMIVDLVNYINDGGFTAKGKAEEAQKGIIQISDYIYPFMSEEINKQKEQTYINYFTDSKMSFTSGGQSYPYIKNISFDGQGENYHTIVELNTTVENFPYLDAYKICLKPFLSDYCFSIFQTYDVTYKNAMININNMLVLISLPVSYGVAGLLVYFVPPLFFRRGRKTLGKALYKIGLVNKNCYVPSFKYWLLRFCIFYVAVYCLSLFTLGIPMIISFTLMAVTKKKQGFADYMLNLIEVDCSKNKIFFNNQEIYLEMVRGEKEPVKFKMKDSL